MDKVGEGEEGSVREGYGWIKLRKGSKVVLGKGRGG